MRRQEDLLSRREVVDRAVEIGHHFGPRVEDGEEVTCNCGHLMAEIVRHDAAMRNRIGTLRGLQSSREREAERAWMPPGWREKLNDPNRQTVVGTTKHPDDAVEWEEVEIQPLYTTEEEGDG